MIYIFHGDNQVKTHRLFLKKIQHLQLPSKRLAAKSLNLTSLTKHLCSQSLFTSKELVIIDELFKLPKSKRRTQLISMIAAGEYDHDVIILENKKISKTQLKPFAQAEIVESKLSSELFTLLDSITPQADKKALIDLLTRVVADNGDWMVFSMIQWKVKQLLTAHDPNYISNSYPAKKARRQAQSFQLEELLEFHQRLLKIDINHKSSRNPWSLKADLDYLLINI